MKNEFLQYLRALFGLEERDKQRADDFANYSSSSLLRASILRLAGTLWTHDPVCRASKSLTLDEARHGLAFVSAFVTSTKRIMRPATGAMNSARVLATGVSLPPEIWLLVCEIVYLFPEIDHLRNLSICNRLVRDAAIPVMFQKLVVNTDQSRVLADRKKIGGYGNAEEVSIQDYRESQGYLMTEDDTQFQARLSFFSGEAIRHHVKTLKIAGTLIQTTYMLNTVGLQRIHRNYETEEMDDHRKQCQARVEGWLERLHLFPNLQTASLYSLEMNARHLQQISTVASMTFEQCWIQATPGQTSERVQLRCSKAIFSETKTTDVNNCSIISHCYLDPSALTSLAISAFSTADQLEALVHTSMPHLTRLRLNIAIHDPDPLETLFANLFRRAPHLQELTWEAVIDPAMGPKTGIPPFQDRTADISLPPPLDFFFDSGAGHPLAVRAHPLKHISMYNGGLAALSPYEDLRSVELKGTVDPGTGRLPHMTLDGLLASLDAAAPQCEAISIDGAVSNSKGERPHSITVSTFLLIADRRGIMFIDDSVC